MVITNATSLNLKMKHLVNRLSVNHAWQEKKVLKSAETAYIYIYIYIRLIYCFFNITVS